MSRIRIGQIGIQHEHASGKFASLTQRLGDAFEVVGWVDDRPFCHGATPVDCAKELPGYAKYPQLTLDQLYAVPGLQAVLVEVPDEDLVTVATGALAHGLAMHMDKPTGHDLAAFRRLREGAAARGLAFQLGYMYRGNPALAWCRKALAAGWLGGICQFEGSMNHCYGGEPYQKYIGALPGGMMYNLGCHILDVIVSLLGRPQRTAAFLHSAPGTPDGILDNGFAVLDYPHAVATIKACSVDAANTPGRRFRLCCTNATIEIFPAERFDGQPLKAELTLKQAIPGYAAGRHVLDFGAVADRYEAQLRDFAAMIRGEKRDEYPPEHDLAVAETLLQLGAQAPLH